MKTFEYTAFDATEKKTKGILSAENRREAQDMGRQRN